MLLGLVEGDYRSFKEVWEGRDRRAAEALQKCIRISYYLLNGVWQIPDALLAKEMSAVEVPEPVRKFQAEWIKSAIARDLGGEDLARYRKTPEIRQSEISTAEAYQLFMAMRKIALDGDIAIPKFLYEIAETRYPDTRRKLINDVLKNGKGRPKVKDGDMHRRRLALATRRSSFYTEIESILDGINTLVVPTKIDDVGMIAMVLFFRRLIEKEIELFLLSMLDKGKDFSWESFLAERQHDTDQERTTRYPELMQAIQQLLTSGMSNELMDLLSRLDTRHGRRA